jgi:cbb3-type cytochrome oxidase maturation protein
MEILYLLIPLSVVLVLVVGAVFWWALDAGQFEDLEGPAHAILMDDDRGRDGRLVSPPAPALDLDQERRRRAD